MGGCRRKGNSHRSRAKGAVFPCFAEGKFAKAWVTKIIPGAHSVQFVVMGFYMGDV
jgi:hypothetical protein